MRINREYLENKFKKSSIYIYGAGQLGQKCVNFIKKNNYKFSGFLVNKELINAKTIADISAIEDLAYHDDIVVLVAICNYNFDFFQFTKNINSKHIYHYSLLSIYFNEQFGDYYFFTRKELLTNEIRSIEAVRDLIQSERSKDIFNSHLKIRKEGYLSELAPTNLYLYYPTYIADRVNAETRFIDAGAFTGDTLLMFEFKYGIRFKNIFAFEPDSNNYQSIINNYLNKVDKTNRQISILNEAVSDTCKTVYFNQTSSESSSIVESGDTTIRATSLAKYINDSNTFIKFDIEGEEVNAINGIKSEILKYKPILAISAYHHPSDLYNIPLIIKNINPYYNFDIELEGKDGMGLVYYFY